MYLQKDMYQHQIKQIYLNSLTLPVKEITSADIRSAENILRNFNNISNTNQLFLVLAAINLLNAAIKKNEFKKDLTYSFIKSKATMLLELLIEMDPLQNVSYFYDREEKCMYVKVYGVIFSFHHITESETILNNIQDKIEWEGVRLQKIAIEVYELALKNCANVLS